MTKVCRIRFYAALWLGLCAAFLGGCRGREAGTALLETFPAASERAALYPEILETAEMGGGAPGEALASREPETNEEAVLYVYVCGEVASPGVYELKEGARAYQAISMAGGLTSEGAAEAVNQAALLEDGQQLWVPSKEEAEKGGGLTGGGLTAEAQTESALVNINQADAARLMTLPGIGEAKAADIIAYREANGPFGAIEDIKNVSGIKDALFHKIKDKIAV